ncbi:asparagine synthase (glutamine-hydrolyzing) [Sphingobium sp. B11D3B]|uniref:asparagine synthase-related protein n=1 Tax=Sphingobium sp. B11D3B TaxID=2940575 RepID=UPI002225B785|nr:asparagine synthase C-terminal domain-containing protein [Sphingobium sp. B11D3B]MCW2387175.1 asparagine synthase (glutamine-hydrolyzing) [Sphingobium sp. B11D3B]
MSALRFMLSVGKAGQPPFKIAAVKAPSLHAGSASLWCSDPNKLLWLPNDSGAIIGRLFSRKTCQPVDTLSALETDSLVHSGGAAMMEHHWGAYVAVLQSEEARGYLILRDPSGLLPCYQAEIETHHVWASDLQTLVQAGVDVSKVDWDRLHEHLQWPNVRRQHSCIAGVSELAPGSARKLHAPDVDARMLWTPWRFVHPDLAIPPDQAVALLRETVFASINALATGYRKIVVTVSGGLDSSIVCAALARGRHRFTCLTMATADASGDESRYADAMASAVGAPLTTRHYRAEKIDLGRSSASHLPRPVGRAFLQELDQALASEIEKEGADAIFTGNGGDNVFCFLHSAAPVVDRWRQEKRLSSVWTTLLDMCRVTQCDVPTMLHATFDLLRARDAALWPEPDLSLLDPRRGLAAQTLPLTPYMETAGGQLPGKKAHVRLLQRIQNSVEGHDRNAFPASYPALLAQPIVETCLRISSWQWCAGGINRSVARRAFSGFLPRQVTHRTSKAGPDSLTACVFEAGRPKLRELLLDGHLRENQIIDPMAIEQLLADPHASRSPLFYRLLDLADAEAWVRSRSIPNAIDTLT